MNATRIAGSARWWLVALTALAVAVFSAGVAVSQDEPDPPADESPAAATDVNEGTALLPSPETMRTLTTETLLAFNRAVRAKNFAPFHKEQLSKQFGAEFSPEALLETFQPFIEHDVNISGVQHVDPVFYPEPSTDGDVMTLKGFYPTRPMRVNFDLSYILESGKWRLHGLNVSLKQAGGPPAAERDGAAAPAGAELSKLVTGTMLEFHKAVQAKDFKALHAQGSTPMRWQTKPDQLKESFESFIEQGVDLSKIAEVEPEFDGPPVVEGQTLTVKGNYPLKPHFLLFDLQYYLEKGEWKLLGIGVNTVSPAELQKSTRRRHNDKGDDESEAESEPDKSAEEPADADAQSQ